MPEFETYTCEECGEEFTAHPSARAAAENYCNPGCEPADSGPE